MSAFHPLRTLRPTVVCNLMDIRRIQALIWGREGPPSRRSWTAMGCGGICLGLLLLFFLRGVSATGATNYYGAWALVIVGGAVLVGALLSLWLRPLTLLGVCFPPIGDIDL